jgi:hypothetical protein
LVFVLTLAAVGASCCQAAEPENLFGKVAVGDWAAYKWSYSHQQLGPVGNGTRKFTVTAKDDKEVTLSTGVKKVEGIAVNPDIKIDLTKPYDPKDILNLGLPRMEATKELIASGKEEIIEVGKTKYKCNAVTITRIYTNPKREGNITFEFKLWIHPNAPLGGIVKQEMKVIDTGRLVEQAAMILEDSGKAE